MEKRFEEMVGAELVRSYNAMVEDLRALGNESHRPVQRFADRIVALRRCEAAASSLRAAQSAAKAEEKQACLADRVDAGTATPTELAEIAEEQQSEPSGEPAVSAPQSENEEDDMAARRKRAAAKAKQTRQARRAANGGAPTLRELTDQFNALVPKAERKGLKWARHHNSLFESRSAAEKQLKRLNKELA